jgi:hypothetical protein
LIGTWLELKSVLVIDNASFYYTKWIKQMCCDASVKLVYLLLYLLDFNLIKEFFAKLKAFIKQN